MHVLNNDIGYVNNIIVAKDKSLKINSKLFLYVYVAKSSSRLSLLIVE